MFLALISFLNNVPIKKCHASSSFRSVSSSSSGASRGGAVVINEFSDLTKALRTIMLRVHPDVVSAHGEKISSTNKESLQELFSLFDALRERTERPEFVGGGGGGGSGKGGLIGSRHPSISSIIDTIKLYC